MPPQQTAPNCTYCSKEAVTRCDRCGTPVCTEHSAGVKVIVGKQETYEVRCDKCAPM